MPLTNTSWNQSFLPYDGYKDDWNPTRNHISIGFIPGYALQSRELLELQTIQSYQTSTSNRCLFYHGQPRVDLERENLSIVSSSPIVTIDDTSKLRIYKNSELFCNFTTLPDISNWIPTGFWITVPPDNILNSESSDAFEEDIPSANPNDYIGVEVLIRIVTGDPNAAETDQFGNPYNFTDKAGEAFQNNQAIGANRLVYEIKNQGDKDNPKILKNNQDIKNPAIDTLSNEDGVLYEGFIPIIKNVPVGYHFAFGDETLQVQNETGT
jgi:hypothetical protein